MINTKKIILIAIGLIIVSIIIHVETYKYVATKYKTDVSEMTDKMSDKDSIILMQNDSIFYYKTLCSEYDSLVDSLEAEIFIKNYQFMRIGEYCEIVKKDQSQQKFLRGWITRVLTE